jgi:hypothetical protein
MLFGLSREIRQFDSKLKLHGNRNLDPEVEYQGGYLRYLTIEILKKYPSETLIEKLLEYNLRPNFVLEGQLIYTDSFRDKARSWHMLVCLIQHDYQLEFLKKI